jgi:2-dehydropantoate 2-reductase
MSAGGRIVVLGAGSIGCYVGGALIGAGADVCLLARPRIAAEIAEYGLTLHDYRGHHLRLEPDAVRCVTDPSELSEAELVLVTVKSGDTPAAADAIALHGQDGVVVVSLQNGIDNVETLRRIAPRAHVIAGMVPFNVAHGNGGCFVRATEGELQVADDPALARWAHLFERARLPLLRVPNLKPVQWGKLLLNLNNPVNALSGVPLAQELALRDFRRCVALLMREGMNAMRAAGIEPGQATRLPTRLIPAILSLPDGLFRVVAKRMLAIDPAAHSSMAEDLDRGRRTEIDHLCGAIVRLGDAHGVATPSNRRMIELVHAAEAGGRRAYQAAELLAALRSRRGVAP